MKNIQSTAQEILTIYERKMSDLEKFEHILKLISEHVTKVRKLKVQEDRPGHLHEEIVDIHLLTTALFLLEKIDDVTLQKSSRHFLEKISTIYTS